MMPPFRRLGFALLLVLGLVCGWVHPALGAPAHVQGVGLDDTCAASPRTLAYGSNVVSGNLLIAVVTLFDATLPVITGLTDTVASTWALAQGETEPVNSVRQEVWYAVAGGSGANTVSVAFTGTCTNMRWGVVEASGVSTLDKMSKNNSSSASTWTSNATTTTAAADEYLFGALRGGTRVVGLDAGWTLIFDVGTARLVAAYQIVTATGTYAYSGTYDLASPYTATITTFQAAAAGGSGSPAPQRGLMGVGR